MWLLADSQLTIIPFIRTWPILLESMPHALVAGSLCCGQAKRTMRSEGSRDEGSGNLPRGRRMLMGAGYRLDILSPIKHRPARVNKRSRFVFWLPSGRPAAFGGWLGLRSHGKVREKRSRANQRRLRHLNRIRVLPGMVYYAAAAGIRV
jgi:hypothetical protein